MLFEAADVGDKCAREGEGIRCSYNATWEECSELDWIEHYTNYVFYADEHRWGDPLYYPSDTWHRRFDAQCARDNREMWMGQQSVSASKAGPIWYPDRTGVYFIETEPAHSGNPPTIKIGHTGQSIRKRMANFRTTLPRHPKLMLLLRGGDRREKQLHKQFAEAQIVREMFSLTPDVLAFVNESRRAMGLDDYDSEAPLTKMPTMPYIPKHL